MAPCAHRLLRRPASATKKSEREAFGDELTDDASAAGGRRDRRKAISAFPRRTAREHQVREIRAGVSSQDSDRGEKSGQRIRKFFA